MPDDEAFIRAILADPDAVAIRLIYADRLEEGGDPRGDLPTLPEDGAGGHFVRTAGVAARRRLC